MNGVSSSVRVISRRRVAPSSAERALQELRVARRRHRLRDIHWSDSLYRLYVTVISVVFLAGWGRSQLGTVRLSPRAVASFAQRGPSWIGLSLAVVMSAALRSGQRGGPIALEPSDLHHVLQAPVNRRRVLTRPLVHQIRRGVFLGGSVGGLVALFADTVFPGGLRSWLPVGIVVGACVGVSWIALSTYVSTTALHAWHITVAIVVLCAWALVDALATTMTSPFGAVGSALAFPLDGSPIAERIGFAIVGSFAAVMLVGAYRRLGSVRMERAVRRAALVSQLRFAVTTQDLRTAFLLRRQLADERARRTPIVVFRGGRSPTAAIMTRNMRGFARWPISRSGRVVVLMLAAGAFGAVAWPSYLPVCFLSGGCLYLACLDLTDALAQDADRSQFVSMFPRHLGRLANRQLIVPALALVLLSLFATLAAVATTVARDGSVRPGFILTSYVVAAIASLFALAGATLSLTLGPPSFSMMLQTPELSMLRSASGMIIASAGSIIPLLAIRTSLRNPRTVSVVPGLLQSSAICALVCYLVLTLVTSRGVRSTR